MARPIKETPTLYGEDARRFEYEITHPDPVSEERVRQMLKAYNHFKSVATFSI